MDDMELFDDVDLNLEDMELNTEESTPVVNAEVVGVFDNEGNEVVEKEPLVTEGMPITEVVDTLMNADPLDVDSFFGELGINDKETKGKSDSKKSKAKPEKKKEDETPEEPEFTGPRIVKVYGEEMFIEEDPSVTLETIRQRIVSEFKFPEFSKERTIMSFDKNTGIIVPVIEHKKKG